MHLSTPSPEQVVKQGQFFYAEFNKFEIRVSFS